MLKNIAVQGCTLKLSQGTGNISITNDPSDDVKINGKGVYTSMNFSISGFTGGEITVAGSGAGSGSINTTVQNVKVDGKPVLVKGDKSAEITINGQKPSGSGTDPASCIVTVEISDAGQDKVDAE